MKVRFLLHDVFGRGGGVLTVTLGLAEALAATHDVEIVSLFGHDGEPVHRIGSALPRTVLIDTSRPPGPEEARRVGLEEPNELIPSREPRYRSYSRYSDQVLKDYLSGLEDGALITMQPGLNIASARFAPVGVVRIAQDHRPFVERPRQIRREYATHASGLDAFLTLTAEDERLYREFLGDATRVARMPNGTPQYAGPPSTLDTRLVVAAGRLERSKGFDLLIEAWRTVAEKHPDWRLAIYGDGSQAGALREQVGVLGLDGQVELKGFSTELQERMAGASLFVLSSRVEGYGMVLVEAMACGVPVVSTDAPFGPAEIVSNEVDGLLVPNEDVGALAAGIIRMIETPAEQRLAMGRAARAKAQERSYPAIAERWRDLLAELQSEPRRQRRALARLLPGSATRRQKRPARPAKLATPPAKPGTTREAGTVKADKRQAVGLLLNAPEHPEPERTYVIFGTRRGGTSMVAGIARALGLDLGEPGARKNNEDPRFHARPPKVLRETVAKRNGEAPVWGWKYPAAGSYLPEIYNELRNPYFIVVYRDPVAAALSQQRLDKGDNTRTGRLALHESTVNNTTNTGFVLAADRPCLLISIERAIGNPDQLVDDVADFLQVPRPEGDLRERILAYIKPGQYKSFDEFFTTS